MIYSLEKKGKTQGGGGGGASACQPNIPKQRGLNNRNCQILYFFYSEGVDPAGAKEVNDLLSTKS